jgi:hypothetical protein
LEKRLSLRARTLGEQYHAEKEKRQRKEDDLRIAEARIEQLENTLKELEDIIVGKPEKTLPAHTQNDSPELHASKKSRVIGEACALESDILNPVITPASSSIAPASTAGPTSSAITPAKTAEPTRSSFTPAKTAEPTRSSITPAKTAEPTRSSITPPREAKSDSDYELSDGSPHSSAEPENPSNEDITPAAGETTMYHSANGCSTETIGYNRVCAQGLMDFTWKKN